MTWLYSFLFSEWGAGTNECEIETPVEKGLERHTFPLTSNQGFEERSFYYLSIIRKINHPNGFYVV